MKILNLMLILIGLAAAVSGQAAAADREKELVEIPLNNYLEAHATGNAGLILKAFYKDARIMSFRGDKLGSLSVGEFAALFTGKAAPDERERKRTIESIDVSGNAAVAKITLDYPAVVFTDYMSLLKIDGEWKIVNKAFYAEPKPPKRQP